MLDLDNSGGGGGGGTLISDGVEIGGVREKKGRDKDGEERRESDASEASVEMGDLEAGRGEIRVERDCRICHLSMDGGNQDCGAAFELGCSCKGDLAAAHRQCAESWFKIKGNKICEICGAIAQNISGTNEAVLLVEPCHDTHVPAAATSAMPPAPSRIQNLCQGHRFLNFLLACMVFAFVLTWLFHIDFAS